MPKKTPDPAPSRPWADLPEDLQRLFDAAVEGDEEKTLAAIQEADAGGKPQAKLFIIAAAEWPRVTALAAQVPELTAERDKMERRVKALEQYQPETVDQVAEAAEALHEARKEYSRFCNLVGQAEQAVRHAHWFKVAFGEIDRKTWNIAAPPKVVHHWFRQHGAHPFDDDWRSVGEFTTPAPRPIISRPAPANVPGE